MTDDLEATGRAAYAAFRAGRHPTPDKIDDDTFVLAVPLPPGGIVTSTLCYVLRDARNVVHVVDPGWNSDENAARLRAALAAWGLGQVRTVVVTHLHEDHLGMADRLRQEDGARLAMGAAEWRTLEARPGSRNLAPRYDYWGVPRDRRPVMPTLPGALRQHPAAVPDVLLDDGDILDLGRDVGVILTPGHTEGSITLRDDRRRYLFTGDHVLPHVNPGLGLDYRRDDADPVDDYLRALERIRSHDGYQVLPGHGYRFARLARRIDQIQAHHLKRAHQVAHALAAGGMRQTVWQLASGLDWTHGWDRLEGYFLNSALQQTAMYARFVQDTARSRPWLARIR